MKLLLTAGGGGHFAPLLALLPHLPKNITYLIVLRKYAFESDKTVSFEYKLAKERNLPFHSLTTGRLQRTFTRHTIFSLAKIPFGLFQALQIVRDYKPDVVVSFGGYVTVPVVIASSLLRIPVIIHEQTPRSGLANKIAARFAKKVCISWESSRSFLPEEKIVFTGNLMLDAQENEKHVTLPQGEAPLICVLGGSLGSHAINSFVEESLEDLLKSYRIVHQTGDSHTYNDFTRLTEKRKKLKESLSERYLVEKFIDPSTLMSLLQKSDLVITRSGINTIMQLLRLKKPSLLFPLTHGQTGEQHNNAMLLKKAGLAEIANERTLTREQFSQMIYEMTANLSRYKLLDESLLNAVSPDAASKLLEVIDNVQKK